MNSSRKAELIALIYYTERFSKSGKPIYNSELSDTAGRKTTRTTTQAIAEHYVFHANTKSRLGII